MAKKAGTEDELPKVKLTKENLGKAFRILHYMGPNKFLFGLGMLFLLGTAGTGVVFPLLMGKLVDSADISNAMINTYGFLLLGILSMQAVFSFFRVFLFVQVTENMLYEVRNRVYSQLIRMPMAFFSQRRVGEINSRISSDLAQIQDTFTTNIAEFLRQFIIIVGGIIFLFIISLKLALVMIGVIPPVAVIAVVFGRYIRKLSRQVQDKIAESNTILDETMQGIANVKAFVNEVFEINRYSGSTKIIRENAIRGGKARGAFFSFIIFCLFGAIVLIFWMAVRMKNQGELSSGQLIQFMLYTAFVGGSIAGIAEQYSQIQKAVGATERMFDILDETPENIDISIVREAIPASELIQGVVDFEHIEFTYPSRKEIRVLNEISFHAGKGETIAIVGPSGSGKSTLVSLILRFYSPDSGKILIDGKNTEEYSLSNLRRQMAIVPQDVLLFGGTIRENIGYGKTGATQEEIVEAAIKANAHSFIDHFPEKYETIVGERGIKLSGGQRQRIAIARAVLKDPSILILDEATSSLDSESERLVQEALDKLMKGRTSFVIAHRLSTVRNADKIIVIDKGKVVESGTHNELMQIENGLFKSLSKLQFENV